VRHLTEADLALYATGDLNWWAWPKVRFHISGCRGCRSRVDAFRADQAFVRELAEEIPSGVNWDRLAAEMTANIRVGLAAGECVAPRVHRRSIPMGWRVAGASAGFAALLVSAWWINMPASQTASLGRAMKTITQSRTWQSPWQMNRSGIEESGAQVRAFASGIELRENGSALGVSAQGDVRPASVTLNVEGTARAHYIDSETGQVTITSVYAQ